jgi:hypothetical protein
MDYLIGRRRQWRAFWLPTREYRPVINRLDWMPKFRDLKAAGCEEIFAEQVSAVAQRDRLKEVLRFVRRGDTAIVTRPDRLPRSRTLCGSWTISTAVASA